MGMYTERYTYKVYILCRYIYTITHIHQHPLHIPHSYMLCIHIRNCMHIIIHYTYICTHRHLIYLLHSLPPFKYM